MHRRKQPTALWLLLLGYNNYPHQQQDSWHRQTKISTKPLQKVICHCLCNKTCTPTMSLNSTLGK